jgi:hypothetical protein
MSAALSHDIEAVSELPPPVRGSCVLAAGAPPGMMGVAAAVAVLPVLVAEGAGVPVATDVPVAVRVGVLVPGVFVEPGVLVASGVDVAVGVDVGVLVGGAACTTTVPAMPSPPCAPWMRQWYAYEPGVLNVWLNVPDTFADPAGSSKEASSAVTECDAEPDQVQSTVSPAVIVVVDDPETASVNEKSATATFPVAACVLPARPGSTLNAAAAISRPTPVSSALLIPILSDPHAPASVLNYDSTIASPRRIRVRVLADCRLASSADTIPKVGGARRMRART